MDVYYLFTTFDILGFCICQDNSYPGALRTALKYGSRTESVAFETIMQTMEKDMELTVTLAIDAILSRFNIVMVVDIMADVDPSSIDGTTFLHEVAKISVQAFLNLYPLCEHMHHIRNGENLMPVHCALIQVTKDSKSNSNNNNLDQVYHMIQSLMVNYM